MFCRPSWFGSNFDLQLLGPTGSFRVGLFCLWIAMSDKVIGLALGAMLLAFSLPAEAQQAKKVPRVGYVFSFTPAEGQHLWEACRQGLRELGYVENQNIVLEPRWAEGRHERLPDLVADLVRLKVDVMVAAATPASLAAKAATNTIPIVFVAVADPVRAGLIDSFARPGGNFTGLSLLTPELSGKRLELLTESLRKISRVAVLMHPGNLSNRVFLEETQVEAQRLGIKLQPLEARDPDEIDRAFEAASRGRAGALIVFDDPVIWSYRTKVVALAAKQRLPVMYGYTEFVDEGGLMSYGPNRPDLYRRTAIYVDKILKGAKSADLPVEQPMKFEFFVNLKAAKQIGLTIPQSVLYRADKVIK
jgi:putative tryptophan/tyrosine transport system substrate-binding protein